MIDILTELEIIIQTDKFKETVDDLSNQTLIVYLTHDDTHDFLYMIEAFKHNQGVVEVKCIKCFGVIEAMKFIGNWRKNEN